MKAHSLQREIWLAMVLLATVSVLALTVIAIITRDRLEHDLLEQTIADEFAFVLSELKQNPTTTLPHTGSLQVWLDAKERSHTPIGFGQLGVGRHHNVHYASRTWEVLREPTAQGLLTIAIDTSLIKAHERELTLAFVLTSILVIGAAIVGGWWLSLRLAEPTSRLSQQLRSIAPDDDTPLAPDFDSREIHAIAAAADDLRQRQVEAVLHERLFSAAASHELRTPLSTINSSLELLNRESLSDAGRQRLARANRASAGLFELIESLIFLARPNASANNTTQRLQPIVASTIDALRTSSPRVRIEEQYLDNPVVATDAALLRVLISNLLRNAVHHGQPDNGDDALVTVTLHLRRLEVADNGPGMATRSLEDVLQPYVSGDPSNRDRFGLGLYIVHRICQHLGWELTLEQSENAEGSRFVISFGTN